MVNPYDIILMPWITEKTLEARRVADLDNNYRENNNSCLLYTSPSPRDRTRSRMPSSA